MMKSLFSLAGLMALALSSTGQAQDAEVIWLMDPSELQGLQVTLACPDQESGESDAFVKTEHVALEIPRSHARRLPDSGRVDFLYDIEADGTTVNIRPFRYLISGTSMRTSLQEEVAERTIEAVGQWQYDVIVPDAMAFNCIGNFGFTRLRGGRSR